MFPFYSVVNNTLKFVTCRKQHEKKQAFQILGEAGDI